jgi:hypothetical protein
MTPVVTPTGRSGFGFTEFMVEITGLNVHLDPGTYHLNVTPIGSLDGGRSFDSTTSGANCIGSPCGNNDNAFLDSPILFGAIFEPVADFGAFSDFSMGVNGEVGGGGGNDITLTASAHRHMGQRSVELVWTPADGGMVNIILDGAVIATTEDDGNYRDPRGSSDGMDERLTYQVCETDSGDCSNTFRIKVKGKAGH